MGDTKNGRDQQAREEERRQAERVLAMDRAQHDREEKTLRIGDLYPTLEALAYPMHVDEVRSATSHVTLLLADGEVALDEVVSDSSVREFDTVDDLVSEVMSLLPRRAVGEPYQSEGDAD